MSTEIEETSEVTASLLLAQTQRTGEIDRTASREWHAEFEAAARRPLEQRLRYAFIKTYKPVLDDEKYRAFDSMKEYRAWCEKELPMWLGFGR